MGSRRVNKRGWYVLVSIASDDGAQCADVFEHPAGGFGFQHFRSDPEDQGGWTPIDGVAQPSYKSAIEASQAAAASIGWLRNHPRAAAAIAVWEQSLMA